MSGAPGTGAIAARVERDVVAVHGPDATSFLQSLVSQDLEPVAVGETVAALLLQPQGKLIADFRAHRADVDTWLCVCEGGFGPVLAAGLGRFKIRVAVEIEMREVAALAVRGLESLPEAPRVVVIPVGWGGVPAFDVLGPDDAVTAFAATLDVPEVDTETYEMARIDAGVPRLGFDIDERTIPQEAELELDAVSFTKGCFVGQELVCRIDARGHVNRLLRRLRAVEGAPAVPLGRDAEVIVDGRPVGAVTSPGTGAALAMIRREVAPGTTAVVGETRVVVQALRPG